MCRHKGEQHGGRGEEGEARGKREEVRRGGGGGRGKGEGGRARSSLFDKLCQILREIHFLCGGSRIPEIEPDAP